MPNTEEQDAQFLLDLDRLKAYALNRADEAFMAGDRILYELWSSRSRTLGQVTAFEDLGKGLDNLSKRLAKSKGESEDRER